LTTDNGEFLRAAWVETIRTLQIDQHTRTGKGEHRGEVNSVSGKRALKHCTVEGKHEALDTREAKLPFKVWDLQRLAATDRER
jgi:hypothetical protein